MKLEGTMQENSGSSFDAKYNPSGKTKFLLMGLLLILNIVIRLPSIPHEKGYDSFTIHLLANTISTFSSAKWWLNWLCIFGLYPDSYASAVPFSLSGISQVTGIEMEKTILLFCILTGLLGICSAYVFAGRIYNNFLFKYIMSFFFSLSPGLMLFTTWEVSTRGQFIVFLPFFLFTLLNKDNTIKKYILLTLLFIFILSTHHYAYFLIPFSILYTLLTVIQKMKPEFFTKPYLSYFLLFFFIVGSALPFFTGMFIDSGSRYSWITVAIMTNLRQVGPALLLLPGGLLYLFLKRKKFEETFMCFVIVLLSPVFYSQSYGPFILLLICIFLVSIAFNNLLKILVNRKYKFATLQVIAVIFLFLAFSSFFNHYRTGQTEGFWYMGEDTYNSGIWAKNHISENTHGFNTGFETARFFAISERHPICMSDGPIDLANGWFNESAIVSIKNSPTSSAYYFDGPYSAKSGTTFGGGVDWLRLTARNINDLKSYDYFILDNSLAPPWPAAVDVVKSGADLIYDSPSISIWKIPK